MLRTALAGAIALGYFAMPARAGESPTAFILGQAYFEAPKAQLMRRNCRKCPQTAIGRPVIDVAGNSDAIREASRFIGSRNITGHSGAWCAWFVSFVLERIGHRPLSNGLSYSALSYGPRLAGPRVGALIVLPRHVGFVARVSGDRVTMLSGNWSGRVALAVLPIRAAIAYIEVN